MRAVAMQRDPVSVSICWCSGQTGDGGEPSPSLVARQMVCSPCHSQREVSLQPSRCAVRHPAQLLSPLWSWASRGAPQGPPLKSKTGSVAHHVGLVWAEWRSWCRQVFGVY